MTNKDRPIETNRTDRADGLSCQNSGRRRFLAGAAAFLGGGCALAAPGIVRARTDTIAIGFPVPLTGPYQLEARDQVRCAQLAVDRFNAEGGLDGQRAELLVRDDHLSPGAAAAVTRALVQKDGARFIVGSLSATVQLSVAHVASSLGAVYVSISQSDAINEKANASSMTFHEALNPFMTCQAVGKYAFPRMDKRVAYLVADYTYGHEMARGLQHVGQDHDMETVAVARHPIASPDFKAFLPTLFDAKPDVVCLCNFGRDQLGALRDAHAMGLKDDVNWVAPVLLYHQRLQGGAEVFENVVGATNYHWTLEERFAQAKAFNDAFRAQYGEPPSDYGAYGFSGVSALLAAIRKASSTDPTKVAQTMRTLRYETYKGPQWFRSCDRQSVQSVFVVGSKAAHDMAGEHDVFEILHTQEADEKHLRDCGQLGY